MGTRFMATTEAPIKQGIKDALVKGTERDTTLVMRSLRNTERVFKNDVAMKVRAIEKEKPNNIMAIRKYVRGENYRQSFQETGDAKSSVWSCGLSMALIDDCPTAAELIQNIMNEAETVMKQNMS